MKKIKKKRSFHLTVYLSSAMILIFLFFILVTCAIYVKSYENALYDTAEINVEQAVSLVSDAMTIHLNDIERDMALVISGVDDCRSESQLKDYITSIVKVRSSVVSVAVYDLNGKVLCYGTNGNEIKNNQKNNQSFLPELFDSDEYNISVPHVQNMFAGYYPWVITTGKRGYSKLYGKEVYISMDISFTTMMSYIDSVGIGQRGYCFVINNNGEIVYHPQQQVIYSGIKNENLDSIKEMHNGITMDDKKIYAIDNIVSSDWKVVGISYVDEMINERIKDIYKNVVEFAIIGLIILAIFIVIVSNRVSRPVRELSVAMKAFEKNAEQFQYNPVHGVYELESLSESFDHMVMKIQELMVHIVDEEKTLRKTELKALQAQINPHFLYNTLDSIQWMCEKKDTEKAIAMVSALAKLFRISISKGKELIPIEKELDHVRSYLVIQSYRFKGQFEYYFEVDEKLLNYYCNKITLQPIVENSIIHGLEGMYDEGEIHIRVIDGGDHILMQIEDNGVGMTKEQCQKIIAHDESDKFGIGIKNVNDRLKIYFGQEYGLKIESELDCGTKVIVKIPKLTEEEARREGGVR